MGSRGRIAVHTGGVSLLHPSPGSTFVPISRAQLPDCVMESPCCSRTGSPGVCQGEDAAFELVFISVIGWDYHQRSFSLQCLLTAQCHFPSPPLEL